MDVRVHLTIDAPGHPTARHVTFGAERVTLGRSSRCDIQLPVRVVSSHHLTFERRGSDVVVRDEGSTNGTEIDGQMAEPRQWYALEAGMGLRVVDLTIEVGLDGQTTPDLDAFTLAQTGTMAREMLSEALEDEDEELAYFELVGGPDRGRRFYLPDDLEESLIGRADDCVVCIPGEEVSEHALSIAYGPNGFTVSPVETTDAWLNGDRLEQPCVLGSGDQLAFDGRDLAFFDPLESHLRQLEHLDGPAGQGTALPDPKDEGPEPSINSGSGPSPQLTSPDEARSEATASEGQSSWGLVETALLLVTLVLILLVALILLVTFEVV